MDARPLLSWHNLLSGLSLQVTLALYSPARDPHVPCGTHLPLQILPSSTIPSSSALTSTLQEPWFFSGTSVNSSLFSFLGWSLSNVALVESLTQKQVPKWSCHSRTLSDGDHKPKPLLIGTAPFCPSSHYLAMLKLKALLSWPLDYFSLFKCLHQRLCMDRRVRHRITF